MDVRALSHRIRHRSREALVRRFAIDVRALAALRVSLGFLVLADLLFRSRDLVAFYTDSGVLPRVLLREQFPVFARLSLHALSGSAWMQGVLFLVAGGCALALTIGYRTKMATVVSFVLLASLHARNPLVLNAGDSILRRLLFWSVFLPLGERWSVDAARGSQESSRSTEYHDSPPTDSDDHPQRRLVSVASVALLVQVVVVYTANAAFKLRGDRWLQGEAIRYALSLDQLTVFLGDALVHYPVLLGFLDRVWLGMLVSSAMLILLAGRPRTAFASLFVVMHLGMALTMRLGIFPLVSIAALLAFLPRSVWDEAERFGESWDWEFDTVAIPSPFAGRIKPFGRTELADRIDVSSERVRTITDQSAPNSATRATVVRWKRRVQPPLVALLLTVILVWNAATLGIVELPATASAGVDPTEYRWDMFAPEPRTTDGWYVVPGELSSETRQDVLHGSPVQWDPPPDLRGTSHNVRWFKYLVDLQQDGPDDFQHRFVEYLCERWNRTHDTFVERLTVYYVEQPTRFGEPEPTNRVELLRHSCSGT